MNTLKKILKNHWPLLTALIIQCVVYNKWLLLKNLYTQGDWGYYTSQALTTVRANYFSTWLQDNDLGRVPVDIGQAPSYAAYGLLSKWFGLDFAILEKLIHMFPIIFFGTLSIYLLLRYLFKSKVAIFLGVLIFNLNTYSLTLNTGHLTLSAAFSLAPLVLFYFIRLMKEKYNLELIIKSSFALLVVSFYEPRSALIYIGILFIYFVFNTIIDFVHNKFLFRSFAKKLISFSLVGVTFVLFSSFWILGLATSNIDPGKNVLNRSLFGSQYFTIEHAFALHQPYWNGGDPVPFISNPVPFYFWLVPILAISGLYLGRNNKKTLIFGIIGIIGILLSKQSDPPFVGLYQWLFDNIPGFDAFREASKFYSLIVLSYAVLVAAFFNHISDHNIKWVSKYRTIIIFCLLAVVGLNALPFVNSNAGSLLTNRTINPDYVIYNNFINKDKDQFRVLYVPLDPRWATFDKNHTKTNLLSLYYDKWQQFNQEQGDEILTEKSLDVLSQNYSEQMASITSIKYVVLPIRDQGNDDDFFIFYGNNRDAYEKKLDSISWLKPIDIGSKSLKVYINTNFKPPVTTSTKIFEVDSFNNINNFSNVLKNANTFDYQFVEESSKNTKSESISGIKDIFDINKPFLPTSNQDLDKDSNHILAIDYSKPSVSYEIKNGQVSFTKSYNDQFTYNGLSPNSIPGLETKNIALDSKKDYGLAIGNNFYPLDTKITNARNIGPENKDISLYSLNGQNMIEDGGFENKLWASGLKDCNDYDQIKSLTINRDDTIKYSGEHSLKLGARLHTACTSSSPISVTSGETYNLKYYYLIKNGQKAGFTITFNDSNKTQVAYDQYQSSEKWYQFSTIVKAPSGATQMVLTLKGYPDLKNKSFSTTNYDDVSVLPIASEGIINSSKNPYFKYLPITDSSILRTNVPDISNKQNLIVNGSLEKGLWQKVIGDCNAYDKNPILKMSESNNASDGAKSIELSATRHNACTGPPALNVKEGSTVQLSFDYQTDTSSQAGFNLTFDDIDSTSINERIDSKDNRWTSYSKTINVPYGATKATLSIYSYSDENGSRANVVRYDNFKIKYIANISGKYFLLSESNKLSSEPRELHYINYRPTKRFIDIKGAKDGFYLNLNESYSKGWQLEFNNSKSNGINSYLFTSKPDTIADDSHYKLNGYLNTWYVDVNEICKKAYSNCELNDDGTYDLKLVVEYSSQRYLYLGGAISVLALGVSCTYTIIKRNRNRRN